jgi:PAS domain S-box-containing protein
MEKTIWEKNNLLNSLIESTSDSIYVKDLGGNYQLFNKSAGQFTGKNSSDVIGRNDASLFSPPEASAIMTSDHKILENGNVETIEETLTAASGEIITFLTTKGPIFDADGKVAGLFGIARDISYLKKIEETLRKSERNYSTLVENSTDMIARFDKDFNCIFYNRAAGKYTGIPINRLCITDYLKTDTSLDETDFIFIECLKNVFETGMDIDVEERFITPDGEIYFQTEIIPEYNGDRRIETILIVSRDITEKKYDENKLEQYRNHLEELIQLRTAELTESEKRYREITNSITDYVYQVKIDEKKNVLTNYTEGCYPITGYHSLEFTKDPYLWHNTVYPEDQNNVKMFISNIYKDPDCKTVIEHRIVHKEGSIKWINNTVVIHRNSEGDLTGYDGVIRDITERKTAEEEIVNLNRHIIKLQEEERQRVAQDLHDSVGQSIIAAKMNIDTYKQDKNYFAEQLDVGLSFLIKASQELRDIYTGLYPTVLNDFGFEKAIKWLLQNTVEKFSIKTDVNISIADKIPHNIEVGLYRIIQEIISNILKHASASAVQINLTSNENMVTLVVKDNGVGFKSAVKKTGINGYGLANIKNRIISFNGQISIEKNTPTGVSIIIVINLLPMNKSHNSK